MCFSTRFGCSFNRDVFLSKLFPSHLLYLCSPGCDLSLSEHPPRWQTTQSRREECVVYLRRRNGDWHKPSVFRAWSNSFNGLPTVHSKVWFCSTKWEQQKKTQTIYYAVCVSASQVIVCNLFPTLGYSEPFFSIFQWFPFFSFLFLFSFFLDPACCWLNSCLQPWCQNITENYIIILKLVNKERQRSLNHEGTRQ